MFWWLASYAKATEDIAFVAIQYFKTFDVRYKTRGFCGINTTEIISLILLSVMGEL